MKTFELSYPLQLPEECPQTVVALGFFDGIHKGHQKVMTTALEIAKEKKMESAVMTFYPHPSIVLGKTSSVASLTPLEMKAEIIQELGFDRLYIVSFTKELASLSPQQFVDEFLIPANIQHVVAGFDFTFGHKGSGTMSEMARYAKDRFSHTVVPKVSLADDKISSSLIRSYISEGKVDDVITLLGRLYEVSGTVIHGEKRGRTIGFPTANIDINDLFLLPPTGVYAVQMKIRGKWHDGVCNIGYKPTFHNKREGKPSVEVHLFAFQEDIYGEQVIVKWHKKIRAEKKFQSIEELTRQIEKDKEQAYNILQQHEVNCTID